jgi:hypothetical protein
VNASLNVDRQQIDALAVFGMTRRSREGLLAAASSIATLLQKRSRRRAVGEVRSRGAYRPPHASSDPSLCPEDLSAVLQLWEAAGCMPRGDDGLSVDEAVELIGSERAVTLVGEADGRIVAMVLATASAPIA